MIWTTTPWTIPANRAISYGPKIGYGLYRVESVGEALEEAPNAKAGDLLVMADVLAEAVFAAAKVTGWSRLAAVDPSAPHLRPPARKRSTRATASPCRCWRATT